jgi:GNAT superfamily N-acetyltransferase
MTIIIRNTVLSDYPEITRICKAVYPTTPSWAEAQIASHIAVFPEGQFVAEDTDTGKLLGFCASLIVSWDDYTFDTSWRDFTASGYFTNHDPVNGRTLYGAEIMVDPSAQGKGIGKMFYAVREALVLKLGLLRIRAGARLRGYCTYAQELTPEAYVEKVVNQKIFDPTLSFQLRRGFHVLEVTQGYLRHDPESLGYAAVIEWINEKVADPSHRLQGNPRFRSKPKPTE